MTIEEAIKQLTTYSIPCGKYKNAYDMAIDTMRKYQKITEIMRELNGNFYGSYLKDRQALEKIYEVLEDGKND